MLGMKWSWDDLEATPMYVRWYCWDLLRARNAAEAARANKPRR